MGFIEVDLRFALAKGSGREDMKMLIESRSGRMSAGKEELNKRRMGRMSAAKEGLVERGGDS